MNLHPQQVSIPSEPVPAQPELDEVARLWLGGGLTINKHPGESTREEMLAAVDSTKLPTQDVDKAANAFYHKVTVPVELLRSITLRLSEMFKHCSIILSGHFEYPENGYMGWHTNSSAEGLRLYAAYATGQSGFRYVDGAGRVVDSTDLPGWNFRLFSIRPDAPLWHSVWAESPRLSIGFRIINNL